MKEFNLSDMIVERESISTKGTPVIIEWFDKNDVKEFIKRLKEEIYNKHYQDGHCECVTIVDVDKAIDKLAGDKLI